MHYIADIEVVYGDQPSQAPANRVLEVNNKSDDINHQFGGSYVWLVPTLTTHHSEAVTSFEIAIQKHADPSKNNIAKGSGGDYRYLLTTRGPERPEKVIEVALLRSDHAVGELPAGWTGTTIDIIKGRGKTYLYLLWKIA